MAHKMAFFQFPRQGFIKNFQARTIDASVKPAAAEAAAAAAAVPAAAIPAPTTDRNQ